jgi:uncharacterized membrane protein YfcA
MLDLLALPLGLLIGTIGSLTGIGGGFLLMPILLLIFPDKSVTGLAIISMTVVLFNSLAGSVPSILRRRVNWKLVVPFALATIPTGLLGLLAQSWLPPGPFRKIFGAFMLLSALFLMWRQMPHKRSDVTSNMGKDNFAFGLLLSLGIGFISSFFGVGGGFLFVPLFVYILGQPVRQATANSQLILVVVSLTSLVVGIIQGQLQLDIQLMAFLVVGVVGGAQIGSALAERLHSGIVMVILALMMILAGLRMLWA